MNFDKEHSRILFLRYALPCGSTLAKRGVVSPDWLRELIRVVSVGGKVDGHPERVFKTALGMCVKIARKSGAKSITEKSVRKYFLFEHDSVINKRFEKFGDFNMLRCRTYAGKVSKATGRKAAVKTLIGTDSYRSDFLKSLKRGDFVVVHRNFVVEKISRQIFNRLSQNKESYFKQKNTRL